MSGLLSNARRALLRPANPRDDTHTASRIIGSTLPVTIASTLFRHRSMVSDRPASFHQPHGTSGLTGRCCAHSSMYLASRASMPSCRNGATARLLRRGDAKNIFSDPHPESFAPQYFPGFPQAKTGIVEQFRSPLFVRFPLKLSYPIALQSDT